MRPHIKMLTGDYQCFAYLAQDRGMEPHCRLCRLLLDAQDQAPAEDIEHLLTSCRATADTRSRIMPEILNALTTSFPSNRLLTKPNHIMLTQFLLDPCSMNLPNDIRLPPEHMNFTLITKLCCSLTNALHKDRTRQLKAMGLLP